MLVDKAWSHPEQRRTTDKHNFARQISSHFRDLSIFRLIVRSFEPEISHNEPLTLRQEALGAAQTQRLIRERELVENSRLAMLILCDQRGLDTAHIELK